MISIVLPYYLYNIYYLYAFTYLQIAVYIWFGLCKEKHVWPFVIVDKNMSFIGKYEIPFIVVAYAYATSIYGCYVNNNNWYAIYAYAADLLIYTIVIFVGYKRRWTIY